MILLSQKLNILSVFLFTLFICVFSLYAVNRVNAALYILTLNKNIADGGAVTSNPNGISCGTSCIQSTASYTDSKNWSADPMTSAFGGENLQTGNSFDSADLVGSRDNIRDNNLGTSFGANCNVPHFTGLSCFFSYTDGLYFSSPIDINKIEIDHEFASNEVGAKAITWKVSPYFPGGVGWSPVMEETTWANTALHTDTISGLWSNIAAVRVHATSRANIIGYPTDFGGSVNHYTYELRVFGPEKVVLIASAASGYTFTGWSGSGCSGTGTCTVTMDANKSITANFTLSYTSCGLRAYDGAQIITFACEPTGTVTSLLRIFSSGNIYGIVLVDPTDASASKFRIRITAGIRALRKL